MGIRKEKDETVSFVTDTSRKIPDFSLFCASYMTSHGGGGKFRIKKRRDVDYAYEFEGCFQYYV